MKPLITIKVNHQGPRQERLLDDTPCGAAKKRGIDRPLDGYPLHTIW